MVFFEGMFVFNKKLFSLFFEFIYFYLIRNIIVLFVNLGYIVCVFVE